HEALFNEQVAPLLARRCITCHDASTKKGGLDLSSTASRATGGDSGPALQPGAADDSLMWQRIVAGEMPPQQPLIADEQAIVRRWIDEGARASIDPIDVFRYSSEQRAGYDWWSLQPVT